MTSQQTQGVTILLCAVVLVLAGCGEGGTGMCLPEGDAVWQGNITATVNEPQCPIDSPSQPATVDYAVDFASPSQVVCPSVPGYSLTGSVVRLYVYDDEGAMGGMFNYEPWWELNTPNLAEAQLNGWYNAMGVEYDSLLFQSDICYPGWPIYANAWVLVGYNYGVYASLSGPPTASPYTNVTVTASASNYVAPLSYSWTRNGTPMGASGASITNQVQGAGYYTYAVTITDVEGDTGTQSHTVNVQPECSECFAPPPPNRAKAKR